MVRRFHDARVTPLEVCDVLVDGAPLHARPPGPDRDAAVGEVVASLCDGSARREGGAPLPAACRSIARVVFAGGGARSRRPDVQLPASLAADPEGCGLAGGLAFLEARGLRGLVADVGQSRLKVGDRAGREAYARDARAVPVTLGAFSRSSREAFVAFVAGALRWASAGGAPEGLVLGLPCEVGPDLRLGACTYPWAADDGVVRELLEATGWPHVPTWVANDAELAASGIARAGPPGPPTLVVTLGFGVGAALVDAP